MPDCRQWRKLQFRCRPTANLAIDTVFIERPVPDYQLGTVGTCLGAPELRRLPLTFTTN
jgi:hypothetical protein